MTVQIKWPLRSKNSKIRKELFCHEPPRSEKVEDTLYNAQDCHFHLLLFNNKNNTVDKKQIHQNSGNQNKKKTVMETIFPLATTRKKFIMVNEGMKASIPKINIFFNGEVTVYLK